MPRSAHSLKSLLADDAVLVIPGIHDGYSARLIQKAGYPVAFASGAGISEARYGWADRGLMDAAESVAALAALTACAPSLRIIADGDTGYGNAMNVRRTVRAFERVGAAAVLIEDQVWPKRCGHMAGKAVIPANEAAGKIRAAVDARNGDGFLILARTDAAATDGRDVAIDRLNRFADAGADFLFADALLSADDIAAVARRTEKPLLVNMGLGLRQRGTTPLVSPKALQDMGVAAVIYPRMLTAAAVHGMQQALAAFETSVVGQNETPDRDDLLATFDDLNALTGNDDLTDQEQRYVDDT